MSRSIARSGIALVCLLGTALVVLWAATRPAEPKQTPSSSTKEKSTQVSLLVAPASSPRTAEEDADARLLLKSVANLKQREKRLEGQVELYQRFKDSAEFRRAIRRLVSEEKSSLGQLDRFLASNLVSGIGHPSRLGPNSLKNIRLGDYIAMQQGMRPTYAPDERRIAVDSSASDLIVSVQPIESQDQTFQEILWRIVQDYGLEFEIRDGDQLYIRKKR